MVTEFGILALIRLVHPENVLCLISVTELGISKLVKLEQVWYSLFIDYQYHVIKKVEKWIYRSYLRSKRARFNVFNLYLMENPYLA